MLQRKALPQPSVTQQEHQKRTKRRRGRKNPTGLLLSIQSSPLEYLAVPAIHSSSSSSSRNSKDTQHPVLHMMLKQTKELRVQLHTWPSHRKQSPTPTFLPRITLNAHHILHNPLSQQEITGMQPSRSPRNHRSPNTLHSPLHEQKSTGIQPSRSPLNRHSPHPQSPSHSRPNLLQQQKPNLLQPLLNSSPHALLGILSLRHLRLHRRMRVSLPQVLRACPLASTGQPQKAGRPQRCHVRVTVRWGCCTMNRWSCTRGLNTWSSHSASFRCT
mmetsp:Transcript_408/g.1040  ORF Transcript_408/g.1040 Transcript_408/m.1040 type:complete len:272 (+) Transcript_408:126-941(+)